MHQPAFLFCPKQQTPSSACVSKDGYTQRIKEVARRAWALKSEKKKHGKEKIFLMLFVVTAAATDLHLAVGSPCSGEFNGHLRLPLPLACLGWEPVFHPCISTE